MEIHFSRARSCYCGGSYGRYGASSACGITCTGGQMGEICGGILANSVYMTYQGNSDKINQEPNQSGRV